MALRSKVFKVALAAVAGLLISVGTQMESEASGYQDLCTSNPSACEYAPNEAPLLSADVCFAPLTGIVTLKGGGNCSLNSYPFFVKNGEVINPNTGEVQPYIALPDACDMGYCIAYDPQDPDGEEGPMCCDNTSGDCTETAGICPPDKIAVWCEDGEEAVQQNGEWVCQEGA